MLLTLMSYMVNTLGSNAVEGWCLATGLLVRLREDYAATYPAVPPGVWLSAHRRDGDEGVVWLDGDALPLFDQHLDILDRGGPDDAGPATPPAPAPGPPA